MVVEDDLQQRLMDADTLAEFMNLEINQLDNFRSKHPGFVQDGLWNGVALSTDGQPARPSWQAVQEHVRKAWKAGFPLSDAVSLITTMQDLSRLTKMVQDAAHRIFESDDIQAAAKEYVLPKAEYVPFQSAVMFLFGDSWRIRFCTMCGTGFAASKAHQNICSERCRDKADKKRKMGWWSRTGKRARQKSTKQQKKEAAKLSEVTNTFQ